MGNAIGFIARSELPHLLPMLVFFLQPKGKINVPHCLSYSFARVQFPAAAEYFKGYCPWLITHTWREDGRCQIVTSPSKG